MIRKFQLYSKFSLLILFIILFIMYKNSYILTNYLIATYFTVSIFLELIEKRYTDIAIKKKSTFFFKDKEKFPYFKLFLIVCFTFITLYYQTTVDNRLIIFFGILISTLINSLINNNYKAFIENDKLYFSNVFKIPIIINEIVKSEITSDKGLLIFDSNRTIIIPLQEENSLELKNKIEKIQQTQAKLETD